MVIIRLSRVGKTKQPTYRLVVQDKRKDPWGKAFEILGTYNPRSKPKAVNFKLDRVQAWLDKGASCSPTVHNLLVDAKVIKGKKVQATSHDAPAKKTEEKKEEEKKA